MPQPPQAWRSSARAEGSTQADTAKGKKTGGHGRIALVSMAGDLECLASKHSEICVCVCMYVCVCRCVHVRTRERM